MRTQLNVRVQKKIARQVISDKRNGGGTNDIVVEVALENLFTAYAPEQRQKFYHAHGRKPYSRATRPTAQSKAEAAR